MRDLLVMTSFLNCKGCENRRIGCHSVCKTYITAKSEYDSKVERERAEREKENPFIEMRVKSKNKTAMKRKHK